MLQRRQREAWVRAKLLRGVDWPVGTVKQLPTDRDHIRLVVSQDRFGLVCMNNQADGNRRNVSFRADAFGQINLVAIVSGVLGE
jgi:hypothetical protein